MSNEMQAFIDDDITGFIHSDKAERLFNRTTLTAFKTITPEIMAMSIDDLKYKGQLSLTDEQLRIRFQEEFTRAVKGNRKIKDSYIFNGIATATYFYKGFLESPYKIAYALQPIVQYEKKMEALLESAIGRYKELIGMDITTPKLVTILDSEGKKVTKQINEIDPKKAMVLLSVIKSVEERVKGSVLQKNLNINTSEPQHGEDETAQLDISLVDKRIAELEHKLNPFKDKEVIDVTPTSRG